MGGNSFTFFVSPHLQGGVPWPGPASQLGCPPIRPGQGIPHLRYPTPLPQWTWLGCTPYWGVPHLRYPPPPPQSDMAGVPHYGKQVGYLKRRGRYASCVHAGGLSCLLCRHFQIFFGGIGRFVCTYNSDFDRHVKINMSRQLDFLSHHQQQQHNHHRHRHHENEPSDITTVFETVERKCDSNRCNGDIMGGGGGVDNVSRTIENIDRPIAELCAVIRKYICKKHEDERRDADKERDRGGVEVSGSDPGQDIYGDLSNRRGYLCCHTISQISNFYNKRVSVWQQ